jgi:sulfur carrier protein ThiS
MLVRVKLFATLGRYRPGVAPASPFTCEVAEGSTLSELMADLGLPNREVNLSFVNGRIQRPAYHLKENDDVGFFPLIGGG